MNTVQQEKVIVIDFGGQYNQLVARRVRECQVYCEICSYRTPLDKIKEMNPKGIILTGGPNSVYLEGAATAPKELFEMGAIKTTRCSKKSCFILRIAMSSTGLTCTEYKRCK